MAKDKQPRKTGRPRSQTARKAILEAAYQILMNEGIGRLTVERVASETGVGKPTIYRNWANAHELAMAAFMAQPVKAFDSPMGSARHRLQAHLRSVVRTFSTPRGRQITLTLASAEQESELVKAFRNQVILNSREVGRAILEEAIADGSVMSATPVETVLDMLYGPLFFRLLVGHTKLSDELAVQLVETVFKGIGKEP